MLERGINIDPSDIPKPLLLGKVIDNIETLRVQELKEQMAESENPTEDYSLMEESGAEAATQQSLIQEEDSDDDMWPIPPLSNVEIRNLTQIDPDDERLQPIEIYSPRKPSSDDHMTVLNKILEHVMNNERMIKELIASNKSMAMALKSMSGILAVHSEGFNDLKSANLNMQQYNANMVALATQLETTLKSTEILTQSASRPIVLPPQVTSVA